MIGRQGTSGGKLWLNFKDLQQLLLEKKMSGLRKHLIETNTDVESGAARVAARVSEAAFTPNEAQRFMQATDPAEQRVIAPDQSLVQIMMKMFGEDRTNVLRLFSPDPPKKSGHHDMLIGSLRGRDLPRFPAICH